MIEGGFGAKDCASIYNPEIGRWVCEMKSYGTGIANIKVYEYPWPSVEILRDCICSNFSESLTIITKTARKVVVKFTVTDMKITEDYRNYFFDANYELIPPQSDNNCVNPWKSRRLRGSSGEITIRNNAQTLKQQTEDGYQHNRY